jgi:predicted ABC-type ATPase
MPKVVVIAGPNGAGKSTTAPAVLRNALRVREFVNADTIATGLSAFSPETAVIAAGRLMLDRVRGLARERRDFAFETTLASRTFAPWLKGLQAEGYTFHLVVAPDRRACGSESCRTRSPRWTCRSGECSQAAL